MDDDTLEELARGTLAAFDIAVATSDMLALLLNHLRTRHPEVAADLQGLFDRLEKQKEVTTSDAFRTLTRRYRQILEGAQEVHVLSPVSEYAQLSTLPAVLDRDQLRAIMRVVDGGKPED